MCKETTYNYDGGTCLPCPISEAYCMGKIIKIPKGYWRSNSTSSIVLQCSNKLDNCVGNYPDTDLVEK